MTPENTVKKEEKKKNTPEEPLDISPNNGTYTEFERSHSCFTCTNIFVIEKNEKEKKNSISKNGYV